MAGEGGSRTYSYCRKDQEPTGREAMATGRAWKWKWDREQSQRPRAYQMRLAEGERERECGFLFFATASQAHHARWRLACLQKESAVRRA